MVDRKARYERRQGARKRRERTSQKARLGSLGRTIMLASGGLAILAVLVAGVYFYSTIRKELPPTTFGPGHSEGLPPQQINAVPISRQVQEHVMERGGNHEVGRMLVQYNCVDYDCSLDLIEELTKIVQSYPQVVYMAPYPGMDAKIALAAPGRLETFDFLDEAKIREFIDKNLTR